MGRRTPLLMLALVLLGALVWILALQGSPGPAGPGGGTGIPGSSLPRSTVEEAPEPARPDGSRRPLAAPAAAGGSPGLRVYPADRPLAPLEVLVQDPGGEPLAGAEVAVASDLGPFPPGQEIAEDRQVRCSATSDEDGRASFEGLPSGGYRVSASRPAGGEEKEDLVARVFAAVEPGRDQPLVLVLGPRPEGWDFRVRVVDTQGRPEAGAEVEVTGGIDGEGVAGQDGRRPLTAVTDAEGRARFPDTEMTGAVVRAATSDGRTGLVTIWRRDRVRAAMRGGGLEVVVDLPGALEGALTGLPAEVSEGARVRAHALNNTRPWYTTYGPYEEATVEGGRYRFPSLPAGWHTLLLAGGTNARQVLQPFEFGSPLRNSVQALVVNVEPGRTTVQDLQVAAGCAIAGIVRRLDGEPVAGAEIRETFAPRTSNFPDGFVLHGVNVWRFDSDSRSLGDHPLTHLRTRTGLDGRYLLPGLQPGRHRIEVIAPGLSYDRREEVLAGEGGPTWLEHVLEPAGVIQGVLRHGSYLGVSPEGGDPVMIAIVPPTGLFTFPGLPAGRYTLARLHSNASVPAVPMTTVSVEAGRTTWVVLGEESLPLRIRGRLLDADGPVAGAEARLGARRQVTDQQGRFEFGLAFPLSAWARIQFRVDGLETVFDGLRMEAGQQVLERDFVLEGESVEFLTLDAAGVPEPAVLHLRLNNYTGTGPAVEAGIQDLRADDRGRAEVRRIPAGKYQAWVTFASGAAFQEWVDVPHAGPVVLQAPPVGEIRVVGRTPRGNPLRGWQATAWTWKGEGPAPSGRALLKDAWVWRRDLDEEGVAVLRGVRTGEVLVEILFNRTSDQPPPEARPPFHRLRVLEGSSLELQFVADDPFSDGR